MRPLSRALLSLVCGLAVAGADAAIVQRDVALGRDGTVYFLKTGDCEDFLLTGKSCTAGAQILVLQVKQPGEAEQLLVVPATEDSWPEDSMSLLFEEASKSVFVVWESRLNGIHPQLNLASFGPAGWSDVVEVSGSPFSFKRTPQLAISHDTYAVEVNEGGKRTVHRTIVHLIWWEQSGGSELLRYSPLVLEDGSFIGNNQTYVLNELLVSREQCQAGEIGPLSQAARILPGKEAGTIVIVFGDAAGAQLVAVEILVVPGAVSQLGRELKAWVEARLAASPHLDRDVLATELHARLHQLAADLNPALTDYLASQLEEFVREFDPAEGVSSLAEEARGQLIDVGARLLAGGIGAPIDAARGQLIDVGNRSIGQVREHQALVRSLACWPMPVTGAGPNLLLASPSGNKLIAAWVKDSVLMYRETGGPIWSDPLSLELGSTLSFDQAIEILDLRLDNQ